MIVIYNAMHILPRGAEALLIALQTPAPKGYTGIPVLIWGAPKANPVFPGSAPPAGFSRSDTHRLHSRPNRFFRPAGTPRGAGPLCGARMGRRIFKRRSRYSFSRLLTTAPPAVQSALLRVVLERKVGFYPLPSKVRIVAAANPPDLMTGGWDLSPPLRNRFVHLDWELTTDFYLDALQNGYKIPALPTIPVEHHKIVAAAWQLRWAHF